MDDSDHSDALHVNTPVSAEPTPELWLPAIPANADRLTKTRQALVRWAAATGLAHDEVNDLALAVYEAMSNVVDHAYPQSPGKFDLHAVRHEDRLTVTVVDYGRWKIPAPGQPGLTPLRGRGLTLMKGLAAEFELVHKNAGTLVRMSWPLPSP